MARTGPAPTKTKSTLPEAKPAPAAVAPKTDAPETPKVSVAAAAASQIKKATKKTGTKPKTAAVKAKVAIKQTATHASDVSKMAIAAIGKYTEKEYKDKQEPLGARRGPMDIVSSGSLALDDLIGGNLSPDGTGPICSGYPRRYITEIYGAEASGKTTLALEAIARVQKEGGIAMFLDFEHALHHGYAQKLGVSFDKEKLLLYTPSSMEQGLDMLKLGAKVGVDLIVVDSVAAMVPMAEMEKKFSDAAQVGIRARKLADALPKIVRILHEPSKKNPRGTAVIFINQTRANIGGGPMAAKSTTSGGYALKFFAYVRLEATRIGSEYVEKMDNLTKKKRRMPYGNKTQVKVIKSKADAKQGHTAEIFIRYGQGIDDYYSIISTGVAHGVIKKAGAYYDYGTHHISGREKFRSLLMQDEKLFDEVQAAVLAAIRAQAEDLDLSEEDEDNLDGLLNETFGDGDSDDSSSSSEPEEVVIGDDDD